MEIQKMESERADNTALSCLLLMPWIFIKAPLTASDQFRPQDSTITVRKIPGSCARGPEGQRKIPTRPVLPWLHLT